MTSENSFRSVVPQPPTNGFFSIHSAKDRQNTDHEIEVKI